MYEITITKMEVVDRVERGETVKVGQQKIQDPAWVGGTKDVYERLPDRPYKTTEEKEIYKQTVDKLDLVGVINAVNGGK